MSHSCFDIRHCLLLFVLLTLSPGTRAADDAGWSTTPVPGSWEQAGGDLRDYDGFAWYRCRVRVPDHWAAGGAGDLWAESVTLWVEDVGDAYEVFVNGVKLGGGGSMPPGFAAAGEAANRLKVPPGVLKQGVYNTIAVRVYNAAGPGGFRGKAPVLSGYYLESVLSGAWEFRRGDDASWGTGPVADRPEAGVFDQFREASTPLRPPGVLQGGPKLAPAESLKTMVVADDLVVEQVLSEPLVAQPLFMTFDERGRLWVVQYRQYPYPAGLNMVSRDKYYRAVYDKVPPPPPHHIPDFRGADRITIHEDTDADGVFDKHKVFLDGLSICTSVAFGRGGVWVLNPPYLLFYPDANRDDVPDGPPVVHLSGFGIQDTHSVANSLYWGPDGWLYGAQGSTVGSQVVTVQDPGEPKYSEGPIVWRYQPESHVYEVFAEGGGNAFGLEIDSKGRIFSGHNGGNTRGFHYVEGGVYEKGPENKFGPQSNPYLFGILPAMAHAPVTRFTHTFVLYEADALPQRYHGKMFCVDPLRRNVVLAEMTPRGSTFETKDIGIPLRSDDPAFRPVDIKVGPDGAVYIADFYEFYIAHGQHFQGQIDPTTGRIYRLRAKDAKASRPLDIGAAKSEQLVELLSHPNKWHRQTALRVIHDQRDVELALGRKLIEESAGDTRDVTIERLWIDRYPEITFARALLDHQDAHVRAWAIRAVRYDGKDWANGKLTAMARQERDPQVRCQLAISLKWQDAVDAAAMLNGLLSHAPDADDPYLPLLTWWAIEHHCDDDRQAIVAMFEDASLWHQPMVQRHILERLMRRLAASGKRQDALACAKLLQSAPDQASRDILMRGFEQAFAGRSLAGLLPELAEQVDKAGGGSIVLKVRRGEPEAIEQALKTIADDAAPPQQRVELVRVFGEVPEPRCVPSLMRIVATDADLDLRRAAFAALKAYNDAAIGSHVLAVYPRLPAELRPAAETLATARPTWTMQLLEAIERGQIDRKIIAQPTIDALRVHRDRRIVDLTITIFGAAPIPDLSVRMGAVTQQRIERMFATILASPGDPYEGRNLFNNLCGACHRLFSAGGEVGPDLTAYQRDHLSTLLTAVLDPSAEIREGYESFVITTTDGRTLSGFMADRDANVIVLRGLDGQNTSIPREQVTTTTPLGRSLMPSGLLDALTDQQVRDLIAYLRQAQPLK